MGPRPLAVERRLARAREPPEAHRLDAGDRGEQTDPVVELGRSVHERPPPAVTSRALRRVSSLVKTKRPLRVPTRTATPIEQLAYSRERKETDGIPERQRTEVNRAALRGDGDDAATGRLAALDDRLGRHRDGRGE